MGPQPLQRRDLLLERGELVLEVGQGLDGLFSNERSRNALRKEILELEDDPAPSPWWRNESLPMSEP